MKRILTNKLYMGFLISDIISNFGDNLYYLALMTYAMSLEKSNLAISIVNVSETLPVILTVLFGYIADKTTNKLNSILKSLIIRAVLYLILSIVIEFNYSMIIVLFASMINFISDTLGQFENGLFYPVSNKIVKKEDREETMAFRQTVTSIMSIGAQAVGAMLITVLSYGNLARINSLTFILSLFIVLYLKKDVEQVYSNKKRKMTLIRREAVREIFFDLKSSIKNLFEIDQLKSVILFVPVLNGGLAIITPLVVLNMTEGSGLIIINSTTTISLIGICFIIGGIFGGFLMLVNKFIKNLSIIDLLKYELITVSCLFLSVILQQKYLVLLLLLVSSILISCLNPKMGAIIFNEIG